MSRVYPIQAPKGHVATSVQKQQPDSSRGPCLTMNIMNVPALDQSFGGVRWPGRQRRGVNCKETKKARGEVLLCSSALFLRAPGGETIFSTQLCNALHSRDSLYSARFAIWYDLGLQAMNMHQSHQFACLLHESTHTPQCCHLIIPYTPTASATQYDATCSTNWSTTWPLAALRPIGESLVAMATSPTEIWESPPSLRPASRIVNEKCTS